MFSGLVAESRSFINVLAEEFHKHILEDVFPMHEKDLIFFFGFNRCSQTVLCSREDSNRIKQKKNPS